MRSASAKSPQIQRARELVKQLGNLARLRDQIGVLQELEPAISQERDLTEFYGKLVQDDVSPKLDALKELLSCIDQIRPSPFVE